MELIKSPVGISVTLIILAVLVKLLFDARKGKDGEQQKEEKSTRKPRNLGKKAKDLGKTTMRLLRRKALRKSLEDGDWNYK